MPRGKRLTEKEQGKALALFAEGFSQVAIAKRLQRSRSVIQNLLRDPDAYGQTKRPGRKPVLSGPAKRALLRAARKGEMSANQLRIHFKLPIKLSRVKEILRKEPSLAWKPMVRAPAMTESHVKNRLRWCMDRVGWSVEKWERVVFTDEKKFNLDGPDGFRYYWHDLRGEPKVFSKRQNGGGSLMVWGGFSSQGTTNLAIISGNQNSSKHIQTLWDYLIPFVEDCHAGDWTLQQDGASVHRSHETQGWLAANEIDVLEWPAKSPDLNPIENLWGIMARRVYKGCRQFQSVEELEECVMETWFDLRSQYLTKLVESMPRRMGEVIRMQGRATKY